MSARQLTMVGFSATAIKGRVQAGRLHRVHRGVYAVGHERLSPEGRWLAAVLTCGERAVLSHESAGVLWKILTSKPQPVVHVTVPGHNGRNRRSGIKVHRSVTLAGSDVTRRENIPVTTYQRTLRDLGLGPEPTRSHLERCMMALCRRHRIPKPEVNVRVGPYRVDFLWRDARLIVETDGYEHHSSRASFDSDRARDLDLKLRGYEVIRFTYHQVTSQAAAVASSLQALLRQRRGRGGRSI